MLKLLIADDEPLVSIGLHSMLDWAAMDIEIVGSARNGVEAKKLVEELRPDIVITDIKMPLKSGLELAKECAEEFGRLPLFIILTSYEDFAYAREALGIQVVEYLVKLELSAENLTAAVERAKEILQELHGREGNPAQRVHQLLAEKFFFRLYNNLFSGEEQFYTQMRDLKIDLRGEHFVLACCALPGIADGSAEATTLFYSIIQLMRETLAKYERCYITTLDLRNFTVLFCLDCEDAVESQHTVQAIIEEAAGLVFKYFSVQLRTGLGLPVTDAYYLYEGYSTGRRALRWSSEEQPVMLSSTLPVPTEEVSFSFEALRPQIRKAFEELNTNTLHEVLSEIANHFEGRADLRVLAMDAVCSILYMAIGLLPDGENTVSQIFAEEPDTYRSVYRLSTTDDLVAWLLLLRDGCCKTISSQRASYKKRLVGDVQEYVLENLDKRLSLNEVAAVFNFSPNYLSKLFSQYAGVRFVDYIASARVQAAKEMLRRGEGRIYEVAERLGFENAFYFSTVFKKIEGVSPREYMNRLEK